MLKNQIPKTIFVNLDIISSYSQRSKVLTVEKVLHFNVILKKLNIKKNSKRF